MAQPKGESGRRASAQIGSAVRCSSRVAEHSFRGSIHVQGFLIPLGNFGGGGLPLSILSMSAMYIIPFIARGRDFFTK